MYPSTGEGVSPWHDRDDRYKSYYFPKHHHREYIHNEHYEDYNAHHQGNQANYFFENYKTHQNDLIESPTYHD